MISCIMFGKTTIVKAGKCQKNVKEVSTAEKSPKIECYLQEL